LPAGAAVSGIAFSI